MITASVVLYNNSVKEIETILGSLQASPVTAVYVIDHSENDEAHNICCQFSKVEYMKYPNRGYGAGHNRGIRKALDHGAKYHVVINPDIYWDGDAIGGLFKYMETDPDCGLVMPKILFPNGKIQKLCKLLPTPADLFGRRFIPVKRLTAKKNARYEMHWSDYDKVMEVPCLSGCFMFFRCDVLRKVGIFDERFFLYAEDMDLCRRIGKVSKTVYYPHSEVFHAFRRDSYHSFRYMLVHAGSIIKYFNKWGWFRDKYRSELNRKTLSRRPNNRKH